MRLPAESGGAEAFAKSSSLHLISSTAAIEPADAEHIHGGAQGAVAETILADACHSRAMIDGHLSDFISTGSDERWDEAVHAVEEEEGFTTGLAHDFQGAAGVADAVADEA